MKTVSCRLPACCFESESKEVFEPNCPVVGKTTRSSLTSEHGLDATRMWQADWLHAVARKGG